MRMIGIGDAKESINFKRIITKKKGPHEDSARDEFADVAHHQAMDMSPFAV